MDDPVVTTVTTPTPTPTPEATPTTPTTTPTADETRRAVADARRKRILDKSKDRMGIVSGEQSKTTTTAAGEDGGAAVPVDEEPKSSGAARMNAMRRRRNLAKKKEVVDTTATTTETTPVKEESTTTTTTTTTTTDDKKKEETVIVAAAAVVAKEEEPVVVVVTKPVVVTPATTTAPTTATTDTTTPAPAVKKKYKGVAATRRQMLKDKAAKEQAERDESVTKAMTSSSKPTASKAAASIPKFPIYMHLVTILILFSSGLYLGTTHVVQDHVTIHRELLAPQQHGVGVMRLFESLSNRIKGKSSTTTTTTTLLQDEEWAATAQAGDEFGSDDDDDDDDDDDTVHEPNIDPLFNLDLDKFTQGNSLMMMGARFAVGMHRMNLYFFYYLPLGIIKTLVSVPKKLMQTPPLLSIFAVVVRQFMKRVLGATLPDETVKSSKNSKGDVLAMVKNGVVTFLTNSFPTVVGLYDAFTHLRSDMLILLCGIFVGLAWNHHSVVGILTEEHDEL